MSVNSPYQRHKDRVSVVVITVEYAIYYQLPWPPPFSPIDMLWKTVFSLLALFSVAAAQSSLRLNSSVIVPHHYEVDLTLDTARSRFSVNTSISLELLVETQSVEFFRRGLLAAWLSTRIVNTAGEEFKAQSSMEILGGDYMSLSFPQSLPPGRYTLHLLGATGSFGDGLVQVPNSGDSVSR